MSKWNTYQPTESVEKTYQPTTQVSNPNPTPPSEGSGVMPASQPEWIERWKAKNEAQKKVDNIPFRDRIDKQNLWKILEKKCGLNPDWCYNSPEFPIWVKANWEYIRSMENPEEK